MEMKSEEPVALSSEAIQLARKYAEICTKKDELNKQLDDLKAEQDMVAVDLKNKMEEIGLQKFGLEGIGTYYLQTSFYPKILDQDVIIDWLDKNNLSTIAPRTVKGPAFKEMYQERMEKDLPLPPAAAVDAHSETGVRLRRVK